MVYILGIHEAVLMSGAHSDKVTNKCLMPSRDTNRRRTCCYYYYCCRTVFVQCAPVYIYIYIWFLLSLLLLFDSDAPVVVVVAVHAFGNRRNGSQFGWPRE